MSKKMQQRQYIHRLDNIKSLNLEIPWFQRTLIDSHVEKMYQIALNYIKNNQEPIFPIICVAQYSVFVKEHNISVYKYQIIDGQHRYNVYKRLHDEGYSIPINIQVILCANEEEAKYHYLLYNSGIEHTNFELDSPNDMTDLDKEIKNFLHQPSNSQYFSDKICQRPRIKISDFMDCYLTSNVRKNITSLKQFKQFIDLCNEEMKQKFETDVTLFSRYSVPESIIKKVRERNFYLGLDKNFSWLVR